MKISSAEQKFRKSNLGDVRSNDYGVFLETPNYTLVAVRNGGSSSEKVACISLRRRDTQETLCFPNSIREALALVTPRTNPENQPDHCPEHGPHDLEYCPGCVKRAEATA